MNIQQINNIFDQGLIPNPLFYAQTDNNFEIDINKITYNNYYSSYEFFENKFFNGYENIKGFDKIILDMSENAKLNKLSPLEEINLRLSNE